MNKYKDRLHQQTQRECWNEDQNPNNETRGTSPTNQISNRLFQALIHEEDDEETIAILQNTLKHNEMNALQLHTTDSNIQKQKQQTVQAISISNQPITTTTTTTNPSIWGLNFEQQLLSQPHRTQITTTLPSSLQLNQAILKINAKSTATNQCNLEQREQQNQMLQLLVAFQIPDEDLRTSNTDIPDEWSDDDDDGWLAVNVPLDDFLLAETANLIDLSNQNQMPFNMFACTLWNDANDNHHPCCDPTSMQTTQENNEEYENQEENQEEYEENDDR